MLHSSLWARCDASFQFICILATFGTVIWCISEFAKNEDLCQVTFRKFKKDKDPSYPHISLCFEEPFSPIEVERHGTETLRRYFDFLSGKSKDPTWLTSNYDNFTVKMADHFITAFVEDPQTPLGAIKINTTVTPMAWIKCFTVNIPPGLKLEKTPNVWLVVRYSIFPSRIGRFKGALYIYMTSPHQIFRVGDQYIDYWPPITNETLDSYMTDFEIKGVEVLKRRSTPRSKCIHSKNYDGVIKKQIMNFANCTPPYWKYEKDQALPACATLKSYGHILKYAGDAVYEEGRFEGHSNPCQQIKKVDYSFKNFKMEEIGGHAREIIRTQGKFVQ